MCYNGLGPLSKGHCQRVVVTDTELDPQDRGGPPRFCSLSYDVQHQCESSEDDHTLFWNGTSSIGGHPVVYHLDSITKSSHVW